MFNFITYGGHQIDGVAAEEFSTALLHDGMLALAQVQRKIRLLESPYRTPQTHVGGPRLHAALAASSARPATTQAMGTGSTQVQHLVQTELPKKALEGWLADWSEFNKLDEKLTVTLRPSRDGADVLELSVIGDDDEQKANVVFAPTRDRRGDSALRRKRYACRKRVRRPRVSRGRGARR